MSEQEINAFWARKNVLCRPAVEANGRLDGMEIPVSSPIQLAETMNAIAHKVSTGVHHWVTEGEIHWARLMVNLETGERTIGDLGLL